MSEQRISKKWMPLIIGLILLLLVTTITLATNASPPPALVNAHASAHIAGQCASSDGNKYATGFGVDITPSNTGKIFITGQMAFEVSVTAPQVANFFAFESTNATIPSCRELPTFGFDQAQQLCSYDGFLPGSSGGNDIILPIVCSNDPNCPPFCSAVLPVGQKAAVYFVFMNSAGGGYTLTFSSPSAINVQEV